MTAATADTTSPLKRLITAQGVLTVLGLVTGIAVIFLPFGVVGFYGPGVTEEPNP